VPDVWDPLVSEGDPVDVVVEVGTWETPWSIGKVLPSGTVDVIECIVMDDPCPGYRHIAGPLTLRNDGPLGPGVAQAIFRTTFPAGDHDIVATYAGDAFYPPIPANGPRTGDYFFTVNPASSTRLVLQQAQPAIGLGQTDTYSVSFHLPTLRRYPPGT
jgi:hypothetical protein